jgi:UDP-N-acetyl-D-mannosaminuronic acid transferase (WecB/TagA/CpsF family)
MRLRLREKPRDDRDEIYKKALYTSDFLLPDGIALQVWDYCVHTPRSRLHNLNGTDLTPHILRAASDHCALTGTQMQVCVLSLYDPRPQIAKGQERLKKAQQKLETEYQCKTYGYQVPYAERHLIEEPPLVREHLPYTPGSIRILLLALGTPVQETWAYTHRARLEKNHMMSLCVGGFLDFYT